MHPRWQVSLECKTVKKNVHIQMVCSPKNENIMSSLSNPHVIPNLFGFPSSFSRMFQLFIFHSMKVIVVQTSIGYHFQCRDVLTEKHIFQKIFFWVSRKKESHILVYVHWPWCPNFWKVYECQWFQVKMLASMSIFLEVLRYIKILQWFT